MINVLEKRKLDEMTLFYSYIEKMACPTDFAIATGLLDFRNSDKMVCSHYFVNDSNEVMPSQILTVDIEGEYKNISKLDNFLSGIRISVPYNEIKDKLISEYDIDENVSVIEYGYFPKRLIDTKVRKDQTDYSLKLPVSQYQLNKAEYEDFRVYKSDETYYIEYPVNGLSKRINNRFFVNKEKALFSIEPIRFWVDKRTGICISQDVILGGIAYRMPKDNPYEYDDFYDSDLYEALNVIEDNVNNMNKLMNNNSKVKKKKFH